MIPPRGAGLVTLVIVLFITACSGRGSPTTSTTAAPSSTSNATTLITVATTSTTLPTTTSTVVTQTSSDVGRDQPDVDLTLPPNGTETIGPVVVLVHGGSWVAGSPPLLNGWAEALAGEGAVVFNASYTLATPDRGAYPHAIDDIACVVRHARQRAPEFTDSDELIIMGHSAGGHLAAVVSLAADRFGEDCPYPPAPLPDRLVGLAAIYDLDTVAPLAAVFMGSNREAAPQEWAGANPIELVELRPDLDATVVVAENDGLLPQSMAEEFAAALSSPVPVEVIPELRHLELQEPEAFDIDLILNP